MYDWANSSFATTILAVVLPIYFIGIAGASLSKETASAYWGYSNTIAMFVAAVFAPILGAVADHSANRKRFLAGFVYPGCIATALLVLVTKGDFLLASFLYIIGRMCFSSANIFYDSLLPNIAGDRIDQVSSYGYALGYLGGGLLLALNLLMIMKPDLFGIPDKVWGSRLSFVTVGIWWAAFSIPLFLNVPEPPSTKMRGEDKNPLVAGFQRLGVTFREIRKFKESFIFLIAYWLYNDGVGTIIIMATSFGKVLNIPDSHLIGAILLTQFLGIPFTLLFGRIAKRYNPKKSILFCLLAYTGIAIGGFFVSTPLHFWVLAICVSIVQGGVQALSRSFYGSMIPKSKTAEFFSFLDISAKFSGVFGPFIFGIIVQLTGNIKLSIISLVFFFIAGGAILLFVDQKKGIAHADEAERTIQQCK